MNLLNRKWNKKLDWHVGNTLLINLPVILLSSYPACANVPATSLLTGITLSQPDIMLSSLPVTQVSVNAFLLGSALGVPDIRFGLPSNNTLTPSHASQSPSMNALVPDYANQWILVPLWLGGSWQATSELVLSRYDFRQGCNTVDQPVRINVKRTSVIGAQRDKHGQIWHYIGVPFTRTIETDSFTELQKIEKLTLLNGNSNEVTVNCVATITRMDKAENCTSVFNENTTTTYAPLKDGLIQVTFATNDFDTQNRPIYSSTETCIEKRIKAFQEIDRDERGELRHKFDDFLLQNGMSDLINHSSNFQWPFHS